MKKLTTWFLITVMLILNMVLTNNLEVRAENSSEITKEDSEETREKINISSAEELADVANKFSKGILSDIDVVLQNDIDMTAAQNFEGFSSFNGHFHGNGYTISGVKLPDSKLATGFFGYVEKGALVEKLTLEIEVTSDNSTYYVGGIAGVNAGTISECTVKGKVTGTGATGGICGLNGAEGQIISSKNYAVLTGRKTLGGIAGINRGQIASCSNFGAVNATEDWLSLEDSYSISYSYDKILSYMSKDMTDAQDFGGIAGYSLGVISDSANEASVGYGHYGKNIGGIAGRVCGQVETCVNSGKISGKQDVGGIVGQFEPFIAETEGESLSSAIDKLSALTDKLNADVSAAEKSFEKDADKIGDQLSEDKDSVSQYLDKLEEDKLSDSLSDIDKEDIKNRFDDTKKNLDDYQKKVEAIDPDEVSKNTKEEYEAIKAQMQELSDTYNEISARVTKHTDRITGDMNAINDQMNDINNLTQDRIDNLKRIKDGGAVIEDYSAVDPDNKFASKILDCANLSIVDGNRNVGGIVGSMAIEGTDTEDSEENQSGKHVTYAVIKNCSNKGVIIVGKEYGAGICGNGGLGFISDCQDAGFITGENAKYLGGIAGSMKGTISDCYAVSVLEGADIIGGIAGEGSRVRNSVSITNFQTEGNSQGAIIGAIMSDRAEDDFSIIHTHMYDSVYNNYYVGSGNYAIDGANYSGVAEEIEYKKITSQKGCPDLVKNLEAVFLTENFEEISRVPVSFGTSASNIKYPKMEESDTVYIGWRGLPSEKIEGNLFIIAEEITSVVTIQSELEKEGKPVALVSGMFTEKAGLVVDSVLAPENITEDSISNYAYSVMITGGEKAGEDGKLRLLNEAGAGNITIYRKTTDGYAVVDYKKIGSYFEIPFTGVSESICVVTREKNFWDGKIVPIVVGCVVIEGLINLILWKKVRKNNSKKSEEEDGEN